MNTSNLIHTSVEKIIAEYTAAKRMFTAWDITLRLRYDGVQAAHHQVKQLVHQAFEGYTMDRDYTRSIVNVAGATPWLYHSFSNDPSAYDPRANHPKYITPPSTSASPDFPAATVQPPQVVVTRTPACDAPSAAVSDYGATAGQKNTFKTGLTKADSLGRILIPKKALAKIGAKARSVVYVNQDSDGNIVISNTQTAGSKALKVDCYLNVKFKVGPGKEFEIGGDDRGLRLEAK